MDIHFSAGILRAHTIVETKMLLLHLWHYSFPTNFTYLSTYLFPSGFLVLGGVFLFFRFFFPIFIFSLGLFLFGLGFLFIYFYIIF